MIDFVSESSVSLVQCMASDDMVAMAAWVSNGLDDSENLRDKNRVEKLISFLYKNKHFSPFEHGTLTFRVDTPIFVAREFMRHRTFSYNETSGRYRELEPRFYMAPDERPLVQEGRIGNYTFAPGDSKQNGIKYLRTLESYESAWYAYQEMLAAGIAKEVARNVLPVGIMTQFYATCNPRNLMQFLTLRNDDPALYEIRAVAQAMETIFSEAMPLTYIAYARARSKERYPLQVINNVTVQDDVDPKDLANRINAILKNNTKKKGF